MTPAARPSKPPQRVRPAHVEWVAERLTERDRQIAADVNRLRLVSAMQVERLHFAGVAASARARVRRRTLARLVAWRVLMSLERRIGGVRAGSAGLVFALDSAGQRIMQQAAADNGAQTARVRRPGAPTERFVAHTLAVSEIYISLREAERHAQEVSGDPATPGLTVEAFEAEPGSWWPDGLHGWLKPDAYVALATAEFVDHIWVEVDRATESLPALRRKLAAYIDFVNRGQLGPQGLVPRVLVAVPDAARAEGVRQEIGRLPEPAGELFEVVVQAEAAGRLVVGLVGPEGAG